MKIIWNEEKQSWGFWSFSRRASRQNRRGWLWISLPNYKG